MNQQVPTAFERSYDVPSKSWTSRAWWLGIGLVASLQAQSLAPVEPGPTALEEAVTVLPVVFEGIVLDPHGAPAAGALVVSSAGGRALADRSGRYRLEVGVPREAQRVQISATEREGGSQAAHAIVDLSSGSTRAWVRPLELEEAGAAARWMTTFGQSPGVSGNDPSSSTNVFAMSIFDDGSGPALYACGSFLLAGGVVANGVAKWDGSRWTALAGGMIGYVSALLAFDDGSGPALYAGGSFTGVHGGTGSKIARWDGTNWSAVGNLQNAVADLEVFDDGSGPALFAIEGGTFSSIHRVVKWNGSTWADVGSANNDIFDLLVFDDGSGPALYAAGFFTTLDGVSAQQVARWDGSSWTAIGNELTGGVGTLSVFDDGAGPALYAGCIQSVGFTLPGSATAQYVAKWDGSSWVALGSGTAAELDDVSSVDALASFDDGSGPALYAGGRFDRAGGQVVNHIAKWDGSSWSPLGTGLSSGAGGLTARVQALTEFDGALHVGGAFVSASGAYMNNAARWDGSQWTALGKGLNSPVRALAGGEEGGLLAIGGLFTSAGGASSNKVVGWDGSAFVPLGSWPIANVFPEALTVFDDGSGPAFYAGGAFTAAGGSVLGHRARKWDGSTWATVGSTVSGRDTVALSVFDDGSGAKLYAGGRFDDEIACWNGSTWSLLGSGIGGFVQLVDCLATFDDGGGPALYVGGLFTLAGGGPANSIAKWNGSSWSALGGGVGGGSFPRVRAMAVFDDGNGPALYAGGEFTTAGGFPVSNIARWDGSGWSAVGSGTTGVILALATYDDGSGPALYAGGAFTSIGGSAANHIAKWDGTSWAPVTNGVASQPSAQSVTVEVLTVFNDRTGPALFVGGSFTTAIDSKDSFLAKWGRPDTSAPVVACPQPIFAVAHPGAPGAVVTFHAAAEDAEDPAPDVQLDPPSGSVFPHGTTYVVCTATDFSGNQTTCTFPVTVGTRLGPVPSAPQKSER